MGSGPSRCRHVCHPGCTSTHPRLEASRFPDAICVGTAACTEPRGGRCRGKGAQREAQDERQHNRIALVCVKRGTAKAYLPFSLLTPLFLVREAHAEAVEPRPQSKWDVDRADTAAAERVRRLAAAARDAIVFAPCEYVAMPILAAAPSHPSSPRARPRRISLSLPSLSLSRRGDSEWSLPVQRLTAPRLCRLTYTLRTCIAIASPIDHIARHQSIISIALPPYLRLTRPETRANTFKARVRNIRRATLLPSHTRPRHCANEQSAPDLVAGVPRSRLHSSFYDPLARFTTGSAHTTP